MNEKKILLLHNLILLIAHNHLLLLKVGDQQIRTQERKENLQANRTHRVIQIKEETGGETMRAQESEGIDLCVILRII